MTRAKIKRQAKELGSMEQTTLGFEVNENSSQKTTLASGVTFREGNPKKLYVGDVNLFAYLQNNSLGFVIRLAEFLQAYDYSGFTKAYSADGRPAIHPRIILALIMYGMLTRQWSLRQLEALAVRDVGAWWVCGGLQPDHSTIGKFLILHAELLSETFFITLTQQVIRKLNLSSHDAAGDGTVIEAAASHYKTLKAEAAELAAQKTQEAAERDPSDKDAEIKAQRMSDVAKIAVVRQEERRRNGKPVEGVQVVPTELQAVVQPLKNKAMRPAYKPSILVDQNRFIVGQYLHPTNEPSAIKPMLSQHQDIHGMLPKRLLLDAGYHNVEILNLCVSLELDVLCPSGSVDKDDTWEKRSDQKQIPKSAFRYDEEKDVYTCPQKKELVQLQSGPDANGRAYKQYRCRQCAGCPILDKCTSSKNGRTIKRYDGEEVKEAMTQVLQHPLARQQYRRRQALVEPAFAELKERQGLKRFHRKGLKRVKVEFALHCVAYNLKRAIRLEAEAYLLTFTLYSRQNCGDWKIVENCYAIISNPVLF